MALFPALTLEASRYRRGVGSAASDHTPREWSFTMTHFAFGILTVAFVVLCPLLYLAGYQARRLAVWARRGPAPQDRVWFFLLLSAILGLLVGSFAQPLWDAGVA